ncbi:MAG: hypothetical protein DCC55_34915 [Chloroflexi bacterium]|nr:MAG: hypothetical protein DCC55_34915 [Chloroflexota bacterium]
MLGIKPNNKLVKLAPFVREALAFAEAERVLGPHQCLTTGHLLLGLLRVDVEIINILHELGVDLKFVRGLVHSAIRYSSVEKCRKGWSSELGQLISHYCTLLHIQQEKAEHELLVLQLVSQPNSIGSQILASLGVTKENFSKPNQ